MSEALTAEEDENGVVWIRDASGTVLSFMHRSVYDQLEAELTTASPGKEE